MTTAFRGERSVRREPLQVFARAVTYGLVAWCLLSKPALAQETCSPTFEGEHGDALRQQIVLPRECPPSIISLTEADDGMMVQLARNGRGIARRVSTVAAAAAWAESWLMPEFELPDEIETDPESTTDGEPTVEAKPERLWTWATLLRGSIDTDGFGWMGVESAVGRHVGALHFSGAGHFELVPSRDTFAGGLTARVGVVYTRQRFHSRSTLGLGLRWVSAPRPRNNPMMPQKFQLHTIPYAELRSDLGIQIADRLSFVFGVDARFAFTSALARAQFSARVGLLVAF